MILNVKKITSYIDAILCILILSLSMSIMARADVLLEGKISLGDNDTYRINPTAMLSAFDTYSGDLISPQPVNPIHFNLTESITLKQIDFDNINNTSASLYLVIWKNDWLKTMVVNTRSSSVSHGVFNLASNTTLPPGDYLLAIVGQCFNPGGRAQGWSNNCYGRWNYDDFEYTNINLHTVSAESKTNSLAFIQRHHIGDSNDNNDGYAGRWYPDEPEDRKMNYNFTVSSHRDLQSVTIYNYRDLIANGNTVKLKLVNKNASVVMSRRNMTATSTKGDYVWDLNQALTARTRYRIVVQVTGSGDKDDISWDDVVLKFGSSTGIDHYRIDHPGNALTCESASITVKACTNSFVAGGSCEEATSTSDITLIGTPDTAGETEIHQSLSFSGSTTSELAYTQEDTLTLSLSGIDPKRYYCNNSGTSDCEIEFSDAGFKFSYGNSDTIADQVAGVAFSKPIKLKAFYNEDGKCKNIFDGNQIVNVGLGIQCKDPGTCTEQKFRVGGKVIGQNAANEQTDYKPIALTFNQNSADITPAWFEDAGSVNLIAKYTIDDEKNDLNGLTIKGQSNAFWVKPDKFTISATDKDDKDRYLNGSSATSKVIYSAAKPFTLKVTAVNRQGNPTQNYQPANPINIEGRVTRLEPTTSDSADGHFQYSAGETVIVPVKTPDWRSLTTFSVFKDGVSISTDAAYDEVGIIQFDLQDKYYHGRPIEADRDGVTIGRFTPDHFTLTESSVENFTGAAYDFVFPDGLSSYAAGTTVLASDDNIYQCVEGQNKGFCVQWIPGSNQFEPGVGSAWNLAWTLLNPQPPSGSAFTYMEQPELKFNYKLEARNLDGKVTRNYIGDYNKAEVAKLDEDKVGFVADSDGREATDRLADFSGYWCKGVYQSGSCANYGGDTGLFSRLTTGPDGPFMNTYFGIKLEDTDEVKINELDMLPASSANSTAKRLSQEKSELRYGRWTIADGYGPINQPFPVSMQLEYFNGKEFVLNKDDSITAFSASAATATFNKETLGLTGSGTFQDGFTQKLIINAHSHIGDVRLKHTAPIWLQYNWSSADDDVTTDDNPAAIISFGFFRGNDRIIYRRRVN